MPYIKTPQEWEIPESQVTPESDYIRPPEVHQRFGHRECQCLAALQFNRLCAKERG